MESEHSRLLKYFTSTTTNQIPKMEETPAIKIQKEYVEPKNVESKVPGSQKMREVDDTKASTSEVEIKTADFSWSPPVMTVTQKETTLTKGDMKMQKMTVTEDISADTENGGFRITYASHNSTHLETTTNNGKTEENSNRMHKEGHEEKKSKIPIMRLRQVVERVKRERAAQKAREKPRRSSIPRLKDPEKVKRQSSLQIHPRTEDEFEKIYEEIVDNKEKEIDDKILAINIEDTEKVESKFEELMNSLEDDVNDRQIVTKVSKIPSLRRKDDEPHPSKLGALVDKVKVKNTVTETKLKDGGFKVTASSIRTKRFSRGSSRDLSREEEAVTEAIAIKESSENVPTKTIKTSKQISKDGYEVETTETIEYGANETTIKQTTTKDKIIVTEPVKTEKVTRSISKEIEKGGDKIKTNNTEVSNSSNKEVITKEIKNENGIQTVTTTTIVTENSKGVPKETKTVIRGINKESDKETQNINVREVKDGDTNQTVTTKQYKDGDNIITSKTIVTETVKTSPVITETIVRNISREISSESQNIEAIESKETKNESNNRITKETVTREVMKTGIPVRIERFTRGISIEMGNIKPKVNKTTVIEIKDNNDQSDGKTTTTTETLKGKPVKEVKTTRQSSKDFNNADQSIQVINKEVTTTQKVDNSTQKITKETVVKESLKETTSMEINDKTSTKTTQPNKDGIKQAAMTTEDVVIKEGIKIGIPQFTKVTESFSKGKIESVEVIKSVEWKPADNSKNENIVQSVNDKTITREVKNETIIDDKSTNSKVEENEKPNVTSPSSQPRDPVLETKIKETLANAANKITVKKVTEYESSEAETNVEKNTFILSKSEQNIETTTKHHTLKDVREVSKEATEKKETDNANVSVKDKDSSIESVTILKGNVSRLKNKLSTSDSEDTNKKEVKEEFPKKKSILSKIAVFERLEPKEAYPVNKKVITEKKVSKITTKQTSEEKTKTVDNTTKLISSTNINKVVIETKYNNEPVIVKEYWKTHEGYESLEISQGKIDININKDKVDITNTKPGEIEVASIDKNTEEVRILPVLINTQASYMEEVQNENIKTDHNHLEVPAVMSPGKPDFENEIGKKRPGKINLNIWKDQIEVNKTLVDRKEVFKTESVHEINKTFTEKAEVKTFESQTVDSKDRSLENQVEIPKTSPSLETEIKTPKPEKTKPGKIDFTAKDPIELPKILPDRMSPKLETYEKESEIGKVKPGKIDLTLWRNQIEENKKVQNRQEYEITTEQLTVQTETVNKTQNEAGHAEEVIKILPGNIVYSPKDIHIEKPMMLPDFLDQNPSLNNTDLNAKDEEAETITFLPAMIDRQTLEIHEETVVFLPAEIDSIPSENQTEDNIPIQEYIVSEPDDEKIDAPVILPGKLNLKAWESKVLQNKNLVGTNSFKTEEKEIIRTLPKKIEVKTYESHIAGSKHVGKLGSTVQTQTSQEFSSQQFNKNQVQTQTSQELSSQHSNKNQVQTQTSQELSCQQSNKNRVQTQTSLQFSSQQSNKHIVQTQTSQEFSSQLSNKNQVQTQTSQEFSSQLTNKHIVQTQTSQEFSSQLSNKNQVQIQTSQEFSSQLTNKHRVQTQTSQELSSQQFNKTQVQTQTSQEFSSQQSNKNQVQTQTSEQYSSQKSSVTSTQKSERIKTESVETTKGLKVDISKVECPSAVDPADSPSDPELVDEHEVEDKASKSPLLGNIRNKMYFITNRSMSQNSINSTKDDGEISDQAKSTVIDTTHKVENTINETKTSETTVISNFERTASIIEENYKNRISMQYEVSGTVQNNTNEEFATDTNENEFVYYTNRVQNGTASESGIDTEASREEMTRAKSLAELDLGDVVEGQVRRIVGRIKSVEFGRREEKKSEKINAKEMPKKMSVLEKIALFESKASATRLETTTSIPRTVKKNVSHIISEEEYARRIEDLKTAKTKLGRLEDMLYLPLSNGVEMPVIAVGTALTDSHLLPHLIGAAIDLGYRAFDTAYIYGNEKEVGQAIRAKIDDGTVKREDLFIMSKLWSTFHRQDLVEEACRNSLNAMGLDYFDLYMIHNPMSFKEGPDPLPKIASVLQYSQHDYLDAWFGMEELLDKGLVRSIGVSNFNSQQIQKILDRGRVRPVVNQVECHPYLSQQRLHDYCVERNITLSCFGVLGSKGTPAELKSSTASVIDDALVQVMASGLNVSPAQLLIRYQIECGHNVVVKSSSAAHLWDNLQALTFTLTKAEVDALHALNRNKRTFTFKGMGDTHKNYPFKIGY